MADFWTKQELTELATETQQNIQELHDVYLTLSNNLQKLDMALYQITPSNKCYDNRHVNKMRTKVYNAIADMMNYMIVAKDTVKKYEEPKVK